MTSRAGPVGWRARRLVVAATAAALLTASACSSSGAAAARRLGLRKITDVGLPGGTSRFDYEDVDTVTHRLFIAHLGSSEVDVVDLRTLHVVHRVRGVRGVHGIRVVPALRRVFASASDDNRVVVIDADTFRVVARAPTGDLPDGIAYDAHTDKIFVSDETGGAETVLDARTGRRLADIGLGGDAGNVADDPTTGRILADVQSRDEIAVIDPRTSVVTERWHVACDHDHSLSLDPLRHVAFVGCDGSNELLVLDVTTGRQLQRFSLGPDPDVLAFDPGVTRLYVAAESGVVSIFSETTTGVRKLGQARLAAHAHTVAVDPSTHRVYFPLQDLAGRAELRVMVPERA